MGDLKWYGGTQSDIDNLIHTVNTITENVGTRFGIDKCDVLVMLRGKESKCKRITIESEEVIGKINVYGYKYLGILERSDIC